MISPDSFRRALFPGLLALGFMAALFASGIPETRAFENRRADTTRYEYVAIAVPAGWKQVARRDDGRVQIVELVPSDQNRATWTDFVTIQVYHGTVVRPSRYLEQQAKVLGEKCEEFEAGPLVEGVEFGRPVAFRTLNCKKLPNFDSGEFLMFKAISGREAFYAVSRSWRVYEEVEPPTATELLQWREILQRTQLCLKREDKDDCAEFKAAY